MPRGPATTDLVVAPLTTGAVPVVQAGQTIDVHDTGVLWDPGRVFDSSWSHRQPAQFPIGTGSVVAGRDEGLVGQTVGSQVLLVIPPAKGCKAAGQPQAGIEGSDTLVSVVRGVRERARRRLQSSGVSRAARGGTRRPRARSARRAPR